MVSPQPFIIEFNTKNNNYYIYDVVTNNIYPASSLLVELLHLFKIKDKVSLIEHLSQNYDKKKVQSSYLNIKRWVEFEGAFFQNSNLKFASMLSKADFEKAVANLTHIILAPTSQCNLRCKYCIYDNQFERMRNHGNKNMSWEIAKKSINYLIKMINSPKRIMPEPEGKTHIGFYGGEPLINFNLIKKIVNYIKKANISDHINYHMTTNATLLNREIIEFIIDNNIKLLISLDGPKSENDKNRQFINNKGTFDRITQNLDFLKNIDNIFFQKRVSFNAVISYNTNLNKLFDYFAKPLWGNDRVRFSKDETMTIKDVNKADAINFQQQFKELYDKFKEINKKNLDNHEYFNILNKFFQKDFSTFRNRTISLEPSNKFIIKSGACIPGQNKIYVTTDGRFKICEQIGDGLEIGNCCDGVIVDNVLKIWEKYSEDVLKNCKDCIAVRNCKICYAIVLNRNGKFDSEKKCEIIRNQLKKLLVDFYSILECNPKAFEENNNS